ncbi:MAG: 4-hydroxythreonine-4-phosphate dehydrogenase PdxA [Kiritimatiellaeota bacterium]|nr:4-hydroxythreonine-4-phosphate dehydrogenase PdxA [Kiritimatiellota bacterium]
MKSKPKIALTMGDPAGIGPDIAIRAAIDPELAKLAEIIIYGSPDIIKAARELRGISFEAIRMESTGTLRFSDITPGIDSADCGMEALRAVEAATRDALDGRVDAIVTAPMSKASVNLAGIPFTGHTEFIAAECGVEPADFAMMQSAGNLRVVFVTTHIQLAEVAVSVSVERIVKVARLLNSAILEEGVARPKIAVAAVNPHAGENGFMGGEDESVTKPAVLALVEAGIDIEGPFPSDTLFIDSILSRFDGIVAMYHDQGHIPFKMLAFDRGVNSTLGLPIIRTSVDHGTAFDIAWKNSPIPDLGSLRAAVELAARRAGAGADFPLC